MVPTDILGQAPQVIESWRQKMEEYGHEARPLGPADVQGYLCGTTMEEAESDPVDWTIFLLESLRSVGSTGNTIGMPTDKHGNLPAGYEEWAGRQDDRDRRDDPDMPGLPPSTGDP